MQGGVDLCSRLPLNSVLRKPLEVRLRLFLRGAFVAFDHSGNRALQHTHRGILCLLGTGRFRFHGLRHSNTMGGVEVEAFLSWLASTRRIAASTHKHRCFRPFAEFCFVVMVLFFYPMDGTITSYMYCKHFSVVLQRRARGFSAQP